MRTSVLPFAFAFALLTPMIGHAQERIKDYTVHAELRKDGIATLQEEILYDYGTRSRHGIYRDIPLQFTPPGAKQGQNIAITNLSVKNETGQEYEFTTSGGGNYIGIKIGSPNVWVTGERLYVIKYDVLGATYHSSEGSEFYWNAVGTSWPVPIDRVRLEVALPRTLPKDIVKYACYSGGYGSTVPCEEGTGDGVVAGSIISLRFLAKDLLPNTGMTFSVALPETEMMVSIAPKQVRFVPWWKNIEIGFSILLPIAVLGLMLYTWFKKGKDPEGLGVVTAEYEPPEGLDPIQMSFLISLQASDESITAEIISLAQRGYLNIKLIEKDGILGIGKHQEIEITYLRDDLSTLKGFEWKILEAMFPSAKAGVVATQADLSTKLQRLPSRLVEDLSREVAEKGYYEKDPLHIRNSYVVGGIGLVILAFFTSPLPDIALSIAACGAIVAIVGWFLPRTTTEGAILIDRVEGFREYLEIAEKDRIAFHSDPANDRAIYEKLLPYAIALRLGSAWIKWFDSFYAAPNTAPSWITYTGTSQIALSSMMEHVSSSLSTAMTATRGSGGGGGGFSGGGGGGGGSW